MGPLPGHTSDGTGGQQETLPRNTLRSEGQTERAMLCCQESDLGRDQGAPKPRHHKLWGFLTFALLAFWLGEWGFLSLGASWVLCFCFGSNLRRLAQSSDLAQAWFLSFLIWPQPAFLLPCSRWLSLTLPPVPAASPPHPAPAAIPV